MNIVELQKKLLAVARANPPSSAVPFAFEKRIMARLKEVSTVDLWTFWSRTLWRAATPCIALSIALALWTIAAAPAQPRDPPDLETTIMAPLNSVEVDW